MNKEQLDNLVEERANEFIREAERKKRKASKALIRAGLIDDGVIIHAGLELDEFINAAKALAKLEFNTEDPVTVLTICRLLQKQYQETSKIAEECH